MAAPTITVNGRSGRLWAWASPPNARSINRGTSLGPVWRRTVVAVVVAMEMVAMLEHGGRLLQAVQRYGVPRERWLDLSTGINPIAWQGAPLPIASWNRLPEDERRSARGWPRAITKHCEVLPVVVPRPRFRPTAVAGPIARRRGGARI